MIIDDYWRKISDPEKRPVGIREYTEQKKNSWTTVYDDERLTDTAIHAHLIQYRKINDTEFDKKINKKTQSIYLL